MTFHGAVAWVYSDRVVGPVSILSACCEGSVEVDATGELDDDVDDELIVRKPELRKR